MGITLNKPSFNVDQVNSATYASKRFGEIRKKAKELPQFISENNCIDTVVLDYKAYEAMYAEIQLLREVAWEIDIANRIRQADANPEASLRLDEVMDEEEYHKYRSLNADTISDEELFE